MSRKTRLAWLWLALPLAGSFALTWACHPTSDAHQMRLSPGDASVQLETDFVRPIPGLSAENLALFQEGRQLYEKTFSPAEGLGPLFNNQSCRDCHNVPGTGGGSTDTVRLVEGTRQGAHVPLVEHGGPMIQANAIEGVPLERIPAEATSTSIRLAPPTFGLGLLEAVSKTDVTDQLASDPRKEELGIRGMANWEFGALGRFGRKALKGDLQEFAQMASQFELGLSSPGRPQEHFPNLPPQDLAAPSAYDDPKAPWVKAFFEHKKAMGKPMAQPDLTQRQIDALTAFLRFQAPPAPLPRSGPAQQGAELFAQVGCAVCHVSGFKTGPNTIGVPEGLPVPSYTDLLVHDLGDANADGMVQGLAQGNFWRTPPLWGLRFRTRLMHDGRVDNFGEAIQKHGGEAAKVAMNYAKLGESEKAAIAAFLKTL